MPYTVLDQSIAQAAPTTNAGAPATWGMSFDDLLNEMWAQLQKRVDIGEDFETWIRPKLWLNQAYISVAAMVDLKELWDSVSITGTVDQPFYLVPDVVAWIKRLAVEDPTEYIDRGGRELEMIDEPTYRTLPDTDIASNSTVDNAVLPSAYFRYGRMIVLWPTPSISEDYTLDFRVRPQNLIYPTDSPMLPPEFHEAILYMGLSRAFRALRDLASSADAANYALSILRPIRNTDAAERDAMHMVMQPITSRSQLYSRRRP